jgi:aspartyl-tRNA(Asn)/glutamyl-tRNA(Gln) amidotransferase subunit B
VREGGAAKVMSNWIMTEMLRELSRTGTGFAESPVAPSALVGLVALIDKRTISGTVAKKVLAEMFDSGKTAADIVAEQGLSQISDAGEIAAWVSQAISDNPGPVAEYRGGKEQALNFLVGQVMRFSRGKANPKLAAEALRQALD